MNSENHIVSICAKLCVTSLSVVARNRRVLLYTLNDDGQSLEKPKYIIKQKLVSRAGDDKIISSKASIIKELCLIIDHSVYTVLGNTEIFTLLYELCTI